MTLLELIDSRYPMTVPTSKSSFLVGAKRTIWDGHTLWVSPAVESLLVDDTLLPLLAEKLQILCIPRLDLSNFDALID